MKLQKDDTVEFGVTHEVVINDSKAWIKLGVSTKVQENETADEAAQRAYEFVNQKIIEAVEHTAQTVEEYESSQK